MTENEAIRDLQYLIEEYSAYPPETGVSATVGSLQYCITALKEIQRYREIGTVEECREAVEKQKAKNPSVHKQQYSDAYNCSKCGWTFIHKNETGWFCGQHYKFCPNCGQAIQWNENLEERK